MYIWSACSLTYPFFSNNRLHAFEGDLNVFRVYHSVNKLLEHVYPWCPETWTFDIIYGNLVILYNRVAITKDRGWGRGWGWS